MNTELGCYLEGVAEDYQSLEEHDRIYHRGGYREGDRCKVREALAKSDDPDKVYAKAMAMAERVEARQDKEVAELIESQFGGRPRFTEDDECKGKGEIGFVVGPVADGQRARGRLLNIDWDKSRVEDVFRRNGYDVSYSVDWMSNKIDGRVRKLKPAEMLEQIQRQKPTWRNREFGYWVVDGEDYDDQDQAMLAWKAAMKKYGSAAKRRS